MTITLKDRFLTKVNIKTDLECWEWKACFNQAGYGMIGTVGKKIDRAHRVSYKIYKGEIPQGLFVLHKCDNRKCVNPNHLFLGTNQDNVDDMVAKKRNSKPPAAQPFKYAKKIINMLGKKPDTAIAKLAQVSKYAIQAERTRRNIPPFPCHTRFKKGDPHPRWHKRTEVYK